MCGIGKECRVNSCFSQVGCQCGELGQAAAGSDKLPSYPFDPGADADMQRGGFVCKDKVVF